MATVVTFGIYSRDDRIRLSSGPGTYSRGRQELTSKPNAVGLERSLHQEFENRRVNRVTLRREFFYVTPAEVRSALERFAGQHLLEFREDFEAPEWRASTDSTSAAPHPSI